MTARSGPLVARAPAKVNLTLAVLGRRADGYHELDSLVAFAGCHDTVTLDPARPVGLTVSGPIVAGPLAPLPGAGDDNLVLRAFAALNQRRSGLRAGHFHLVKRLPVAAGIGGGSADAAAALRLLARLNGIAPDDPDLLAAAAATGADVPVCLQPRARRMRGIGHDLGPFVRLRHWAVLVNPRLPVATADVFRALGLSPGERAASPGDALSLERGGNDLEAPALRVEPAIAHVLAALQATPGCRLARMSGSGATCFGLYGDCHAAARAAKALRAEHPGWWVRPTVLR